MGNLVVEQEADSLVVRRNLKKALSNLIFIFCGISVFATVNLIGIFVYHYDIIANAVMAGIWYLLALPYFYNAATYLKNRAFLFDRFHNRVLLNAEKICDLSEIVSVSLEHNHISGGRIPVDNQQLFLKLASGKAVQIEFGSASGASYHELKMVGWAIAEFVGVPSNVSRDIDPEEADPEAEQPAV